MITGAPSSGKTTTIELLTEREFPTVPETARLYFEREIAKGRTIEEIREDGIEIEYGLIDLQLRFEHKLEIDRVAFLDRGLPDSLTFCRAAGIDPNAILSECFCHRYASIILRNQLPFQLDDVRTKDDAIAADLLDEWLERDYSALSYCIARVPVLPPADRLAFVLKEIEEPSLK